MKMREGSLQPCRNHGGLVLTCLMMVSLFVTNTLGSTTQPSPVLPGKIMPRNFSTSSQYADPPTTATFEMECTSPAGIVFDMCWLDNNTMIWIHTNNDKVLKVLIDRQNKSCSYTELASLSWPMEVACSPETGMIYVTALNEESLQVYDTNGLKALWKPEGLVGQPWSVAMNRERIVIGTNPAGHLYLYDRNRVYLGQISILQNKYLLYFAHLSEKGVFAALSDVEDRLIIHELGTGLTVTIGGKGSGNGQFDSPKGVSNVGDYILVSDRLNHRLPVFATNGGFHGNLQFKGEKMEYPLAQAYRSETKLLAIFDLEYSNYKNKIFSLT